MTLRSVVLKHGQRIEYHQPWPRFVIDDHCWRHTATELAAGKAGLLGLWTDNEAVHMGIIEDPADIFIVSLLCRGRRFQSVGLIHAPALRLERAIHDLYGLEPEGSPDLRPWLDHNRWGLKHPLDGREPTPTTGAIYEFLHSVGPPLFAHLRPLWRVARAGAARGRTVFWSSADDGQGGAGRDRG
jgi:Respiratory-chain NADH dehydrogenase, 30 Kd subunit